MHLLFLFFGFLCANTFAAISFDKGSLTVDGAPAPFLFGAEVQYFRARGGSGRNVAPETVDALWDKLLDRVQEAHMNTLTLYVPWDFHEPEEGVFDFEGTLDRDKDGKPDYPSRNLKKFLEKIGDRGIRYVMIRPGPYINAEWGPHGFGAIPNWFFDKYPAAIAKTLTPNKPRTVSFSHPAFRTHVKGWFKALHENILKDTIGPGKPVVFLQLDNESNYFWDSIYERDWSEQGISRYRGFVKEHVGGPRAIAQRYGAPVDDINNLLPPKSAQDKTFPSSHWHYDWYHHHDLELRHYYQFLRDSWTKLNLNEPAVLFTSCDSFNAMPYGLLPRLDYRQEGKLSITTMNVYPKTIGSAEMSVLNFPMKAAHEARLVDGDRNDGRLVPAH